MIRFHWFTLIAAIAVSRLQAAATDENQVTPAAVVEYVTGKPVRGNSLGTATYEPSEKERPFFKRLAPGEVTTGGLAGDYDIAKKHKAYVGWFGVIREIRENKEKDQTELLVEHKYFDGLTDTHILALSFNGSGDFLVMVPGVGHKLRPLALIKAYGKVYIAADPPTDESPPLIKAEFVRHWDWGTFTFLMASGTQRGSEKWRKANRVTLDDIYEPYPDDAYYEKRLGKR